MRVPKVLRKPSSLLLATATAAAVSVAMPAPSAFAACHWKVTWATAGVYPYPDRSYSSLKTKHAGDIVGPYCDTSYNLYWGESYTKVACSCAPGNVGWMRSNALVFYSN